MTQEKQQLVDLSRQILAAVIEPPRRPKVASDEQIVIRVVAVVTLNTPVQGPDVPVAPGFLVMIRQRLHVGAPVGGLAFSRNAIQSSRTRMELADGDFFSFRISNFNQAWFTADTVDTLFEMIGVV